MKIYKYEFIHIYMYITLYKCLNELIYKNSGNIYMKICINLNLISVQYIMYVHIPESKNENDLQIIKSIF